jgi:predicted DNA-binding transcriptional regulator YafY
MKPKVVSFEKKGEARPQREAPTSLVRKIELILELARAGYVQLQGQAERRGVSERTLGRDLQQLRAIGEAEGFIITERDANGVVKLEFQRRPVSVAEGQRGFRSLLGELFRALGKPVSGFTEGLAGGEGSSFLRFAMPELVDGTAVASTLNALYSAWESFARVRFRYHGKERDVEPYAVIMRAGRYYLVGFEVKGSGDWRNFALDRIQGHVTRCATFKPKAPPPEMLSTDAIGWIRSHKNVRQVDVTFSRDLAQTAASRKWQMAQEAIKNPDGTVTLRLTVDDADEVIRWAMSYGGEAWISAPPDAVSRAHELADAITVRYKRGP